MGKGGGHDFDSKPKKESNTGRRLGEDGSVLFGATIEAKPNKKNKKNKRKKEKETKENIHQGDRDYFILGRSVE
jgi:hypothetical protein